jgi:hypothetical protein
MYLRHLGAVPATVSNAGKERLDCLPHSYKLGSPAGDVPGHACVATYSTMPLAISRAALFDGPSGANVECKQTTSCIGPPQRAHVVHVKNCGRSACWCGICGVWRYFILSSRRICSECGTLEFYPSVRRRSCVQPIQYTIRAVNSAHAGRGERPSIQHGCTRLQRDARECILMQAIMYK